MPLNSRVTRILASTAMLSLALSGCGGVGVGSNCHQPRLLRFRKAPAKNM